MDLHEKDLSIIIIIQYLEFLLSKRLLAPVIQSATE